MKSVRHTGIVITNREKSLHFYRDLLGLKIIKDMNESGDFIDRISALKKVGVNTIKMAADDGSLIELLYFVSHPRKADPAREICSIGPSHVAFIVENLDEEYKRLTKAGVIFNTLPQFSPDSYVKVTFCKDPDGTLIELIEVLQG